MCDAFTFTKSENRRLSKQIEYPKLREKGGGGVQAIGRRVELVLS